MRAGRFAPLLIVCAAGLSPVLIAQEASSGFDLRATVSGQGMVSRELTESPTSGAPATAGFRSVAYPTWKINDNWFVSGALEFVTRPYFYEDLSESGYGAKGYVLQASLNYSQISGSRSLLVRIGQLSSTFGSFLLRYDDASNPLVDLPLEYGYYYSPISTLGVAGGEVDVTRAKWDARAQFANSSPANPRSLFARDQYGNWAGGGGYTIRQGFRVGASAYHGPYLDREYKYFWLGEAPPSTTPADALGLDASWAHHHTVAQGEVQHFVLPYTVLPTRREWAAYAELRQTLAPRWYVAGRAGMTEANGSAIRNLETTAGYRPNRFQVLKIDYETRYYSEEANRFENTLGFQLVTTLHLSRSE